MSMNMNSPRLGLIRQMYYDGVADVKDYAELAHPGWRRTSNNDPIAGASTVNDFG
jgi:hypothetical protein